MRRQRDILNDSNIDGQEIIQVYYRDLTAKVTLPIKELCAFEKITLKAHEKKTGTFSIPASQLGYYDEVMEFLIEAGAFVYWVGPDPTEGIATEFSIRQDATGVFFLRLW